MLFSLSMAAENLYTANLDDDDNNTEAVKAQDSYSVVLASVGESKLVTVKMIKETLEITLKEAKDIVDLGEGAVIAKDLSKADAEKMAAALKEAGVEVVIK